MPDAAELPERLGGVLAVLMLVHNEGYLASSGDRLLRLDLQEEAIRLARLVVELLPDADEARAVLALLLLQHARSAARVDAAGELVPLDEQDRSRWNADEVAQGLALLATPPTGTIGPYRVQAEIQAVHARAGTAEATDWPAIVAWYDALLAATPSPVVELNRAVARGLGGDPELALAELDRLAASDRLGDYHLLAAAQADLLRRTGRAVDAAERYRAAIRLAPTGPERRFLERRLAELTGLTPRATRRHPPIGGGRNRPHGGCRRGGGTGRLGDMDTRAPAPGIEPDEADAAIRIRGLRKVYGGVAAVDGIDLDIARGETFALLGPNGAGKSTTVEILEGYRLRTAGEVSVLGVDPAHGGLDWKARLGIVLQSSTEPGNYTVREQLTHFAGFFPDPRDVDEVIAAVGLEQKARTRVSKLSGGQRRRVDVALGIIGRPELLFLDEPTTGFDPEARREFWKLIRSLKAEGTTILLTTHYLDEAAQLGDRAGVILGGRLVDVGRVGELGGPEARVPIVRWREPDGALRAERTERPAELVASVVAAQGGREPEGLEVIRPSLEDIYLQLVHSVGAEARDDEEALA